MRFYKKKHLNQSLFCRHHPGIHNLFEYPFHKLNTLCPLSLHFYTAVVISNPITQCHPRGGKALPHVMSKRFSMQLSPLACCATRIKVLQNPKPTPATCSNIGNDTISDIHLRVCND